MVLDPAGGLSCESSFCGATESSHPMSAWAWILNDSPISFVILGFAVS